MFGRDLRVLFGSRVVLNHGPHFTLGSIDGVDVLGPRCPHLEPDCAPQVLACTLDESATVRTDPDVTIHLIVSGDDGAQFVSWTRATTGGET